MLVKSFEAVEGSRWWVVQYVTLGGEKIRHCEGSFASKNSAEQWARENFRTA